MLVDGVDGVSKDWGVPSEDVAIGGASDEPLALFHPLDGEERVLLLVHGFGHELRGSGFPVSAWLVVHI